MNFLKLKSNQVVWKNFRYVAKKLRSQLQEKNDVYKQKFTNKESFVLMKQRKERNYETILPHTRNTRPNI